MPYYKTFMNIYGPGSEAEPSRGVKIVTLTDKSLEGAQQVLIVFLSKWKMKTEPQYSTSRAIFDLSILMIEDVSPEEGQSGLENAMEEEATMEGQQNLTAPTQSKLQEAILLEPEYIRE